MATPSHTPGPVSADKAFVMSGMAHTFIRDSEGDIIARLDAYGDDTTAETLCDDRAQFIVRACNSHDDLLAALGLALDRLAIREHESTPDENVCAIIRAAIEKVRNG